MYLTVQTQITEDVLTVNCVLSHKMYVYRHRSLNPMSPGALHACVKAAHMRPLYSPQKALLVGARFSSP